jgi:DNA-binding MarR family transcriptional regulator
MERGESVPAAILTVGTRPGQTIEALRRTLGLSHSATVRLVGGLIKDGWIRKKPGPDRRSASLLLTAEGRRLHGRLLDRRRAILEQLLKKLSPAGYRGLQKALEVLLEGTARDRREAQRTCRFCDHRVCDPCPVGSTVLGETAR